MITDNAAASSRIEKCLACIQVMDEPKKEFSSLWVPFTGTGVLILFTLMSFLVANVAPPDTSNWAHVYAYIWLALLILYHVVIFSYWLNMKVNYGYFLVDVPVVQEVLRDILLQSLNQGSVDIRETCRNHSLAINTFRETLLKYLEWHAIEEIGELDLNAGKFFSNNWGRSPQLNEGDLTQVISAFETEGKLNLTAFAEERQVNLAAMKVLFFRYCGANNMRCRTETAPNGDYFVIPDPTLTEDFVRDLDAFMQQVSSAESTQSGKKVERKAR